MGIGTIDGTLVSLGINFTVAIADHDTCRYAKGACHDGHSCGKVVTKALMVAVEEEPGNSLLVLGKMDIDTIHKICVQKCLQGYGLVIHGRCVSRNPPSKGSDVRIKVFRQLCVSSDQTRLIVGNGQRAVEATRKLRRVGRQRYGT